MTDSVLSQLTADDHRQVAAAVNGARRSFEGADLLQLLARDLLTEGHGGLQSQHETGGLREGILRIHAKLRPDDAPLEDATLELVEQLVYTMLRVQTKRTADWLSAKGNLLRDDALRREGAAKALLARVPIQETPTT